MRHNLKKVSEMGRDVTNMLCQDSGITKENKQCISIYIEKFPNGKYKVTTTEVVSESMLDILATAWENALEELKKLEP